VGKREGDVRKKNDRIVLGRSAEARTGERRRRKTKKDDDDDDESVEDEEEEERRRTKENVGVVVPVV
tara:strand:- start:3397 stop:3597 length:201 start_codon:yes stop_codon:yes gene_type:complete